MEYHEDFSYDSYRNNINNKYYYYCIILNGLEFHIPLSLFTLWENEYDTNSIRTLEYSVGNNSLVISFLRHCRSASSRVRRYVGASVLSSQYTSATSHQSPVANSELISSIYRHLRHCRSTEDCQVYEVGCLSDGTRTVETRWLVTSFRLIRSFIPSGVVHMSRIVATAARVRRRSYCAPAAHRRWRRPFVGWLRLV